MSSIPARSPHWLSGWPKKRPNLLYLPLRWSKPRKFTVHEPKWSKPKMVQTQKVLVHEPRNSESRSCSRGEKTNTNGTQSIQPWCDRKPWLWSPRNHLNPQTAHKNGRSPTMILGVKPRFKMDFVEGSGGWLLLGSFHFACSAEHHDFDRLCKQKQSTRFRKGFT